MVFLTNNWKKNLDLSTLLLPIFLFFNYYYLHESMGTKALFIFHCFMLEV